MVVGSLLGLAADVVWSGTCLRNGVQPLVVGVDVEIRPSGGRGLGAYALKPIAANTLYARAQTQSARMPLSTHNHVPCAAGSFGTTVKWHEYAT